MAIEITKEEVFAFHDGGKVRVALSKPLKTQKDLCLAYTPGVAQAVKAIAAEPTRAFDLSAKRNLVAVVQVVTPRDLTKKQLLDVAAIVAERSLDDAGAADEKGARADKNADRRADR